MPQWEISENPAGSKLLESFIEKMTIGNEIHGDVLKQEARLKWLNVIDCDITDVEKKAKGVTDSMCVLLKDIDYTLNSIANF